MSLKEAVRAIQQNPPNYFNEYKVPVTFSQRSAQTPPHSVSQECGGSFYTPPRIAFPRRWRFPS